MRRERGVARNYFLVFGPGLPVAPSGLTFVHRVDAGFACNQDSQVFKFAQSSCQMQGGITVVVFGVDVSSGQNKHLST